jgi:Ni,Fe-hydrogenase I cytochrome b subunit
LTFIVGLLIIINVKTFLHFNKGGRFMHWIVVLFFGVLLLTVIFIGLVLYSLAKQGDERRNFIKLKAISNTFAVIIVISLIEIVVSVVKKESAEMNSFSFLVTISIMYLLMLLYYKKRYGD